MTGSRTRGTRRVGSLYITCVRRLYYVYTHTFKCYLCTTQLARTESSPNVRLSVCVFGYLPTRVYFGITCVCVCMCVSHVDQKKEKKNKPPFPSSCPIGGREKKNHTTARISLVPRRTATARIIGIRRTYPLPVRYT